MQGGFRRLFELPAGVQAIGNCADGALIALRHRSTRPPTEFPQLAGLPLDGFGLAVQIDWFDPIPSLIRLSIGRARAKAANNAAA